MQTKEVYKPEDYDTHTPEGTIRYKRGLRDTTPTLNAWAFINNRQIPKWLQDVAMKKMITAILYHSWETLVKLVQVVFNGYRICGAVLIAYTIQDRIMRFETRTMRHQNFCGTRRIRDSRASNCWWWWQLPMVICGIVLPKKSEQKALKNAIISRILRDYILQRLCSCRFSSQTDTAQNFQEVGAMNIYERRTKMIAATWPISVKLLKQLTTPLSYRRPAL